MNIEDLKKYLFYLSTYYRYYYRNIRNLTVMISFVLIYHRRFTFINLLSIGISV